MFGGQSSVLELCNVFHTGQVESGGCFQRLSGRVRSGLVLKDVSLTVHSGELLAVLGSKGSGKRALLDVISGRAHGATRGQVLLNGAPLTARAFQRCGAYVSRYVRWARVKQVLADLALTHVAHRGVERLDESEYRRLAIGVQLVRDPVILLLDEPTSGLTPLHAYLVLSMLANHARQSGRLVLLSMERPRSDVFPFLDRVAILCLGDVVFTGKTGLLLDYFQSIGFPCPELENPLMYYLCLSTVDRRSRDRFLESTQQIAALVEKFKMEGGPFSQDSVTTSPGVITAGDHVTASRGHKLPLCALGRPGTLRVTWALLMRQAAATFNLRRAGLASVALRIAMLPFVSALLLLVFSDVKDYQRSFTSRSALAFNCMAVSYFISILVTISTFPPLRTRYYQERREGLYSGPQLVFTSTLFNLPLSAIAVAASAAILLQATGLGTELRTWLILAGAMWTCYLAAEQQTIALLAAVKEAFNAAIVSQPASVARVCDVGHSASSRQHATLSSPECRYSNGDQFLSERLPPQVLGLEMSLAASVVFPVALFLFNIILYAAPLPDCIKDRFRE
ncbi:hypothetical protein B566_EDAN013623 [Ephemera danica]|nr:hypothetical protein B566_EDAN013623 [Ephemera danica]